jgi:hypothetical protein
MKHLNKLSACLLLLAFFVSPTFKAQEETSEQAKATIMIVTKVHWNMDNDGTNEEWLALEKEYYDKVTAQNPYIINANFLTHYFTADNSEAIWVSTYANWEDIEKANDKSNELIKAGWPDETNRDQFFEKQSAYYTGYHSDEIYSILNGAKNLTEKPTEPLIYYARVSHLGFPEDGSTEEFKELHNSILENVTYKNTYVKAYYNYRHMWGQDNREYTEVYAVGSLCDVEASFEENQKLMDAKWTAEQQKEFGEKYGKYWSGRHGDYIWTNVPALMK